MLRCNTFCWCPPFERSITKSLVSFGPETVAMLKIYPRIHAVVTILSENCDLIRYFHYYTLENLGNI